MYKRQVWRGGVNLVTGTLSSRIIELFDIHEDEGQTKEQKILPKANKKKGRSMSSSGLNSPMIVREDEKEHGLLEFYNIDLIKLPDVYKRQVHCTYHSLFALTPS